LQISDRIIVFRSGKMAGEVSRAEASQEVLTSMAA
jgi:ABC-type sugar transport system ATPase subunit